MITGYNTDVRHGEVVYHVQTEDKGAATPFIESLVYVGGQVLASKRASYADLLAEGREEKEIVALMDHQHRTTIAAIRHGKLDAKLAAMTAGRYSGQYPAYETPAPAAQPVADPQPALVDYGILGETVAARSEMPPPPPSPVSRTPTPERTLDQVILD